MAFVMKILEYRGNGVLAMVATIIVTCGLASSVVAQESKKAEGDAQAKELIRQWVATERLLGEELNEWREEKARVNERLKLHTAELKLLNEELEKAGKSVAGIDDRRAELESKVSDGVATRMKLREFLLRLKPRIIALEKKFPEALKLQVEESMMVLESINDETSVRDVLQATVNVLEQANTFNGSVYQSNESITIGADTWNAEVIYLGLGRAYFYVGSKAGVGQVGSDGWSWTRNDKIFGEVKKAVEVFKKQRQPQLVELPIQVKP